jgi:hypothetical protein
MRKVRLVVALAAIALGASLLPPATAGATGSQFTETFDSTSWYTAWGRASAPAHTFRQSDLVDGNYMRVTFPMGSHTGSTWFFATGSSESVRLRYRLRFSSNWVPMVNESGKIPGFGKPKWVNDACEEACGGNPVLGDDPYYSARASFGAGNSGGSYFYTPHCAGDGTQSTYGDRFDWGAFHFANGVWYDVDQTLTMNTPGQHDGTLFVKVNGSLVFSKTDLCLRTTSGVPVGNAWMDFYYGGSAPITSTSPTLQWIDIDDVIVNY